MDLLVALCVGLGGVVGAPARFALDRFVADRKGSDFPWGTLVINISGSVLLGVLTGIGLGGHLPTLVKALVGTGFCGAFTTFSTWSFETLQLVEKNELRAAAANVSVSLIVGLVGAGCGIAIGLHV